MGRDPPSPVTESAERTLQNHGVNLISDFIAIAGSMNGAGGET
jgi:hypothetical protein